MLNGQRFPFIERTNSAGLSSVMPYLPITLSYRDRSLEMMALLDTGASVNVLPYEVGLQLGADWEDQTVPIQLSGNLGHMNFFAEFDVCFYRADLAFELHPRAK